MAIASGIAVPQVYVMDNENGINAFAAGHSTSDAVVTVTHGTMKLLSRDELQGVIGHEFSHIFEWRHAVEHPAHRNPFWNSLHRHDWRILLRARGSGKGAHIQFFFGGLLLIIGSIGVFFGRLIQAAVSRQREFLADASSVQFTRNPLGLSSALQKIGGYGYSSWLMSEQAPDAGHLFFRQWQSTSAFQHDVHASAA